MVGKKDKNFYFYFTFFFLKGISIEFGRAQESIKAMTKILITQFDIISPSHLISAIFKTVKKSGTKVIQKPRARDTAAIIVFFSEKPILASIFIPITAIEPNKATIIPPITQSGMVSNTRLK